METILGLASSSITIPPLAFKTPVFSLNLIIKSFANVGIMCCYAILDGELSGCLCRPYTVCVIYTHTYERKNGESPRVFILMPYRWVKY